ncbi:MAG: ankyrin repeat domain-containing protein [Zymomonas mobilis subsp. pomaceae]|uniref:Ankyrin n=1 Tax=Zymomonas mobilis subsp. pomaceae (strain ATCC 29192 / DSM 22645 / JCM 10191 / CCUG 17912 / NBRC 13757 / NCIMB 11200 / NRRL B-4491 / Barker I) TaxID=579138 RepID=F8ETV1_ZYMMT|nr:ankyrin repeat domain-containing protein [Zymomonas mobilis]AEI38048.1 Ankyrin [Zymomonas mobilis subsp. pomaceae ATCC 29192]MDX5949414.1 ankyrin repeat domain-containing protein [Zymomonas mobilis subsp. pomaceae]GEB89157.1 hypothetical protein ZMO02_07940 [Zymomonas mobilis subsp. pomaceae]
MCSKKFFGLLLAGMVLTVPISAFAQNEDYSFLRAVRDRDTNKITSSIDQQQSLINTKDYSSGDTALHIVTRAHDIQWLAYFIYKKAKIDLKNKAGETPLMLAAEIGWTDGAQLLLEGGADPNITDNSGQTPLIMAVQNHNLPMVRVLIDNHADPKITDHIAGRSARDYAEQDNRSNAILKVLDEAKPTQKKIMMGPRPR